MEFAEVGANMDADESDEWSDAGDNNQENVMDDEGFEQFDITLAASHSYMGNTLDEMRGRVVLEPGWTGNIPVLAHHAVVFPGELVPLLLNNDQDSAVLAETIEKDKLFALLCPDESGLRLSGLGVVCEMYAARTAAGTLLACKARALARVAARGGVARQPLAALRRARRAAVRVLPDPPPAHPLRRVRLACLDARRHPAASRSVSAAVSRLDAALTPWPRFVFELLDYGRLRDGFREHFSAMGLDRLMPSDPTELSFWVASNVVVPGGARAALLSAEGAVARLAAARRALAAAGARGAALCCVRCAARVARRRDALATSPAGARGTYCNPGGVVHDVWTVARARGLALHGAPSGDYSWFPGYAWTVAVCARCGDHLGWRFDALRSSLRPAHFYGLCRNAVQPRGREDSDDL